MKTTEELSKELTDLQIKYKKVFTLIVNLSDDDTDIATVYLKDLDRNTYTAAFKAYQKDTFAGTEILLNQLFIGGDDIKSIVKDNFYALRSADGGVSGLFNVKAGELKKN